MPRNCDIDHSLDSNGFRNIVNGSLMISYQDPLSHFIHFPLRRPPFMLKEKVNYSKIRINNFVRLKSNNKKWPRNQEPLPLV